MATLRVRADLVNHWEEDYVNDSTLTKTCPLVRISPYYLLGSYACVGLSDEGSFDHSAADRVIKRKVTRHISQVTIAGQKIDSKNVFQSRDLKIFLVKLDPDNSSLRKAIEGKPAVNLFVPKDPGTIKTLFSDVILNRKEVCGSGRTCADDLTIGKCIPDKGCFELKGTVIRGASGDPLFGTRLEKNTYEYLLGFNVTDVERDNRKKGTQYHFFTNDTLKFLKDKMGENSEDWRQVNKKKVSEDYFKE